QRDELSDWHSALPDLPGARSDRGRAAAAFGDRQGPEMVMGKLKVAPGDEVAAGAMVKAEEISLLVDGELDVERIEGVCTRLRDVDLMTTWGCYHVIGAGLGGSGGT